MSIGYRLEIVWKITIWWRFARQKREDARRAVAEKKKLQEEKELEHIQRQMSPLITVYIKNFIVGRIAILIVIYTMISLFYNFCFLLFRCNSSVFCIFFCLWFFICNCLCVYACVSMCEYVCVCVCVRIWVCSCAWVLYIYIYMYVYILRGGEREKERPIDREREIR